MSSKVSKFLDHSQEVRELVENLDLIMMIMVGVKIHTKKRMT